MIYDNSALQMPAEIETQFQEAYKKTKGLREEWDGYSYATRALEYSATLYHTPLEPDDIVLEIGCACSYMIFYIAPMVKKVYGIDDLSSLPWAQRWMETTDAFEEIGSGKVELVIHDARSLPFPDEFFDKVLTFSVLEHFDWVTGADTDCAKEVYRVLKPNGVFTGTVDHNPITECPPNFGTGTEKCYMYQTFMDRIVNPAGFRLAGDVNLAAIPKDADYMTSLFFKLMKGYV
jgi:SAM-dependent methyltransferase